MTTAISLVNLERVRRSQSAATAILQGFYFQ